MGWITLTLRKQTLRAAINNKELQDLEISHQRRALSRQKNYENSILSNQQESELEMAKQSTGYQDARDKYQELLASSSDYSDRDSTEYAEYKEALSEAANEYSLAKSEYDEQRTNIENYYDNEKQELEEESTRKENIFDDEQTQIETQLEAMRQELESVSQQISTDIESSAVKFN